MPANQLLSRELAQANAAELLPTAPLVPFSDPFAADDDDEPAEPPSLWASFTGFLRDLWQGLR